MTLFWLLAVLMMAVVLALITPALLGRRRGVDMDRDAENVRIARERLQELQADRQSGVINAAQFEQSRNELEQALLIDVSADDVPGSGGQSASGRWALALLIILVPALSGSLYLHLGTPGVLNAAGGTGRAQLPTDHPAVSETGKLPTVEEMLVRLERRLQQQPDDAEGWFTLGRSYMAMGRYAEAVTVLEKVHALMGDHTPVLLAYADALAMASGGRISGKPFALIQKALAAAPDNPTALWLAGMGYAEQGEHEAAVRQWKKLEPLLAGDAQSLAEVRQLIVSAEQKLGRKVDVPTAKSAAPARLKVKVSLDPALRDRASPTDTVFVFARAMQGPPMPLAVVRKQVSDLPLEVTLDDSMAMVADMKLSRFTEVLVGARISSSGNALPQSGDLSGQVAAVSIVNTLPVQVVINSQIP
jgi:cytochrome c-type biogenesis protein CcmH